METCDTRIEKKVLFRDLYTIPETEWTGKEISEPEGCTRFMYSELVKGFGTGWDSSKIMGEKYYFKKNGEKGEILIAKTGSYKYGSGQSELRVVCKGPYKIKKIYSGNVEEYGEILVEY